MISTLPGKFLVALVATVMVMASVDGFSVQPKAAVRQSSRLWAGTPMVPYKVRLFSCILPTLLNARCDHRPATDSVSSSSVLVGLLHFLFVLLSAFLAFDRVFYDGLLTATTMMNYCSNYI